MTDLIAILYRSEALTKAGSGEDTRILTAAQGRNRSLLVTGFLHRENDVFYQWLEGPAAAVRTVFASIAADPRHRDIRKLSEFTIDERSFPRWSMAYSDGSATSLFDWAAKAGISLHMVQPDRILAFLQYCSQRSLF